MTNNKNIEAIFEFICRHWEQFGYGPTLKEIAAACYTSKPNVYRYLDYLEVSGRITRDPGRARSIILRAPCPSDEKKE